ncbi:MAG: hypothetical protein OCD76_07470 [Reichenbachiella sp.]
MNDKTLKAVILSMDLHAKKLHFIQEILSVSNERVIDKLEKVLKKERENLDPILKEKLTTRALKAEEDIAKGHTMTREQMEKKLNDRLGGL